MRRREFITAIGGAAIAWPLPAWAQQNAKLPLIALLNASNENTANERVAAFRAGLKEAGLVEGKDYALVLRFAEGDLRRYSNFLTELGALKPRVYVFSGFVPTLARQLGSDAPIVFTNIAADPIAAGLALSWAKPGGMMTGNVMNAVGGEESLTTKRIQYFMELVPNLTRLGRIGFGERVTSTAAGSLDLPELNALRKASAHFGFAFSNYDIQTLDDLDVAVGVGLRDDVSAFYISGDPRFNGDIPRVAASVAKSGKPSFGVYPFWAHAGLLMTFSTDLNNGPYRAGFQVAKIIRGAKPGDLPIEQADKYTLAVNLKTAQQLGITVPPTLLAQADEVIE